MKHASGSMQPKVRLGVERLFGPRATQVQELQEWTRQPYAVFTNYTGMDSSFRRTIDLLLDPEMNPYHLASVVNFKKILAAEHGLQGTQQAGVQVEDAVDARTGLPVISLYGPRKKPTPEILADVDTIFFEFQDIGMRCYTYLSSLYYLLEAAHEQQKRVVVLDRPNPLGGTVVEGGAVEEDLRSFVGIASIPMRHGMTFGELARWFCAVNGWNGLQLVICQMEGWQRDMWFDETGLLFVPPSPNLPTLEAVTAYSATVYVEGTVLSEGRGTTKPFEWIGAPWLDGQLLADRLNEMALPGTLFRPIHFEPKYSKQADTVCEGIHLHITDRNAFSGAAVGLYLLDALREANPERFEWYVYGENRHFIDLLFGRWTVRQEFEKGRPVPEILEEWAAYSTSFQKMREPYLLY